MVKHYRLRGAHFEYVFAASGGPADRPRDATRLLQAIGHAVVCFGRFEHLLDAILIHVNKDALSPEIYEEHPRTAFVRKVKLLKKWLNRHPPFQDIAARYGDAVPSFSEMWTLRHTVVHAYVESYDRFARTAKARSVEVDKRGRFHYKEWDETVDEIRQLAKVANEGYAILNAIAEALFPEGDEQQP